MEEFLRKRTESKMPPEVAERFASGEKQLLALTGWVKENKVAGPGKEQCNLIAVYSASIVDGFMPVLKSLVIKDESFVVGMSTAYLMGYRQRMIDEEVGAFSLMRLKEDDGDNKTESVEKENPKEPTG